MNAFGTNVTLRVEQFFIKGHPSRFAYSQLGDAHDATFHAWVVVHGCATLVLEGAVQLGDATTREARIEGLLDFAIRGLVTTPGATDSAPTRYASRSSRPTALSSRSAKSR